ncbi:MAG: MFS transporter [Gammaproteobacteria bacterium]|nr:MFS transporter [Gammaproteobacteria bacterium]MBU0787092.1 MFS transporter [Gammaproteobacteria bacterium]MBU0816343.1 MFS transporter [Gammaproteobacteria bacterium]MBU1787980.1 MFS transporter [Gammaproteobacteria bacterium]
MTVSRRQLVPFAAMSASYFAHIGFFNPYLPLWLKDQGLSIIMIGLLTSVQAFTRIFAPYAWGWLSDHTGERVKLLRYGASAALLISFGLWFDFGVVWLALVLLLMFAHTSAMMPMSEAAMAHLFSRGGSFDIRRYGRVRLWGSLGFLFTVLAAGVWFEVFGMGHFPLWTGVSLLAIVLSVWTMPDLKEEVSAHASNLPIAPILRQRHVQWFFAALFFHVLSHIGIYVFFSLYLDSLGYSKTMIGVLWAVSVIVEIGWFFTQSRWLPLLSLSGWLLLCAAAMVLRMGITASSASVLGLLLLAQALHAITFATHHAVCISLLTAYFPGRLRGRGQALYTVIGYGIPGVLGGLAGGALSSRLGLASIFWASMLISLIAGACAYRVWRHQHPVPAAAG